MRLRIVLPLLVAAAMTVGVSAQEAVRPEVGNPLKAARDLLKAQKAREALAEINKADAASNKTTNENYLINYMRFSAASVAGDMDVAARAFDAVVASGKLPGAEQTKFAESLVGGFYRAGDNAKTIQWALRVLKDSPGNGQVRTLLAQSYYKNNECGKAIAEVNSMVQAETSAGHAPAESQLDILASCYSKQKDNAGMFAVLEKQLIYYPKREYWYDALNRVQRKPGYNGRLDLDVYRLRQATGNLSKTSDYMEMTQLALQAGSAAEAKKLVDQAFTSGVMGTGTDADRQKRLRDLAAKTLAESQQTLAKREAEAQAAPDGTGLVSVGFDYVGAGQYPKGIPLIEQGIKKDSLKYPDDAKLHLGIALYMAGQKAKAVEVFRTVKGTDGTSDLAHLWIIQSGRG